MLPVTIYPLLPKNVKELRMRVGLPLSVYDGKKKTFVFDGEKPYIVTSSDVDYVLGKASGYSLYSVTDNLVDGFVSFAGGIRIGVSGEGVSAGDKVFNLKYPTSLVIRVPTEIKGKADEIAKKVIKNGEFKNLLVIAPPSGGKTTLLRCLNFLETADDGQIIVDGETLFDGASDKNEKYNDLRKKRLHFGLVFQQFNLFPHMNVLKNVKISAELLAKDKIKQQIKELKQQKVRGNALSLQKKQLKEAEFSAIDARAKETLSKVGLLDRCAAYPCELSGGQQQRVAIARALALSPDILCFDEPTSALDPELTGEVLKVIKGLKGDSTMIIVTHEMDFARKVADRVVFMADGEVAEYGTPDEIFDNPKTEKLKAFLLNSTSTFE